MALSVSRLRLLAAGLLTLAACGTALVRAAEQEPLPRQVFAHYMGCWPVATGPLLWERRQSQPESLKYTRKGDTVYGGHVRNFDLAPQDLTLSAIASADLEIRRAVRIGLDGFAVDAWAGGDDARRTLTALFAAAEAGDYPFQITICIDPMSGGNPVDSVKELLAAHGDSPKLARRGGKPLVFGYQSWVSSLMFLGKDAPPQEQLGAFRTSRPGWQAMGHAFETIQEAIGQPIYFHYCLSSFFFNADQQLVKPGMLTEAAGVLAAYVPALGGFAWLGPEQDAIAAAVKAAGAEWCSPVGFYQKENVPYEYYGPPGTEWLSGSWHNARRSEATLLQLITWNDYGENTNVAPAYNTRYGLYDLTGFEITGWKTGQPPQPDHDRVYLNYHKHTADARIWPFRARFGPREHALEVVTILPRPATIRLPGRDASYDAPAGYHRQQFPLTAGPVIAELVRDDVVQLRLESPEPITDRPFREDHGLVCCSSEDARLWREDFGEDAAPFWYSEYGDADGDGLPNWYEMYFFGTWLDAATATVAEPDADFDHDGISNLQEYRDGTDPTLPAPPSVPDTILPNKPADAIDDLEDLLE